MLETVGPCRRCRALLVLLVHIFVVDLQGLLSGAFNPPKLPTPSQLPPSLPSFLHGRRNRKEKKHVGTSSASRRLEFHQRKAWTSGDAASAAEDDGDAAKSSIIVEYDDFLPSPNPEYVATDIVEVCMKALLEGKGGSGLEVCFEFSSDRCRAALGGSLERFRQYATNPVFGFLVNCDGWNTLSVGPTINGTVTRGAMQTILMEAVKAEEAPRKFLWTLQKERRPPRQNCWLIHEVIYTKNAFQMTE